MACIPWMLNIRGSYRGGIERAPNTASFWAFMRVMEPASFVMTRKMLLNLKRRAERLHLAASTMQR